MKIWQENEKKTRMLPFLFFKNLTQSIFYEKTLLYYLLHDKVKAEFS